MYTITRIVQQELAIRNWRKSTLVSEMGYQNIAKGLRRLESCLNTGDCSNVFLLSGMRQALEISESQWEEAVAATGRERAEEAHIKAVQAEEKYRAHFRPYIFVRTSLSRLRSIVIAAFIGPRLRHLQLDDALLALPRPIRLARVGDLVREHYRKNNGGCMLFGEIMGYALRYGYDETVVFSTEGSIIEERPGWEEADGRALLRVGSQTIENGLLDLVQQVSGGKS